ncbi:hypothetical protein [Enhygromyxa salina]|uniref:Uncharacterized protein n=1 Tax=Enhygromyxa salina TaxID=215803 RepID=A0A2S9YIR9_9BACT|nr:hypothetical protein [Enhygromyxa salina]PRQ04960.1 hypothetical protein ENSA7_48910 [Enhygromyxa salina]
MLAIALRVLGAALILVALVFPRAEARAGQASASPTAGAPQLNLGEDGGECGEDPQVETIDCGDKLAQMDRRLDEPLVITLLRAVARPTSNESTDSSSLTDSSMFNMSERACTELLIDIWSQESCAAQSRECGKINTGAPPGPAPKLASSSSSAQSFLAGLALGGAAARRLGRHVSVAGPSSRDLEPPVPPPRLPSH